MDNELSKIEEAIFNRELEKIKTQIANVGKDLVKIFEKYGKLKGRFGVELQEFIITHMIVGNETYYAGYSTSASIRFNPAKMPDALREAILNKALKEFMAQIDNMQEIMDTIES